MQPCSVINFQLNRVKEQDQVPESSSDDDEEDDFSQAALLALPSKRFGPEGTRQASVRWFKETQLQGVRTSSGSGFAEWFHGIIARR